MAIVSLRIVPDIKQLTHRNGGLSRAGRSSNKNRPSGYTSLLHHLEDHSGGLTRLALANHALRGSPRFEVRVQAKSVDVRVDTWGQMGEAQGGTKDVPIRSILVTSRDEVNGWREMLAAWYQLLGLRRVRMTHHCV